MVTEHVVADDRRMLLAEAVTFDPGLVVALFVAFLLVCAAAAAVVITGIVSGYRHGRDPDRRRAATAWHTCLAIEAAAGALLVITWAPLQLTVLGLIAPALAWGSFLLGRNSATSRTAERR